MKQIVRSSVPTHTAEELQAAAEARDLSLSELVRRLLDDDVDRGRHRHRPQYELATRRTTGKALKAVVFIGSDFETRIDIVHDDENEHEGCDEECRGRRMSMILYPTQNSHFNQDVQVTVMAGKIVSALMSVEMLLVNRTAAQFLNDEPLYMHAEEDMSRAEIKFHEDIKSVELSFMMQFQEVIPRYSRMCGRPVPEIHAVETGMIADG